MNGNRGQYGSAPLYNLKNKRAAAPQGDGGDKQQKPPHRYRALSVILSLVLPALFLLSLLIPSKALRWFFLIASALSILAMWVLKAFVKSARGTLTVVYLALAVVVGLALFMNSQTPETRSASSRASQESLYGKQTGGSLDELQGVPAAESPSPEPTEAPKPAAQQRLEEFLDAWGSTIVPDMLEYCLPSWVSRQQSPESALWQMIQNSRPVDRFVEHVDGGENDTARTISVRVTLSENNGTSVLKRLQVLMVKVNDVWYVDPNTLSGVPIDLEAEEAQKNQPIIGTTIAPATPKPETGGSSGIIVYYNADGGKYYHAIPNCSWVDERYWPLTEFSFDLINSQQFKALVRCPNCNPPERPSAQ